MNAMAHIIRRRKIEVSPSVAATSTDEIQSEPRIDVVAADEISDAGLRAIADILIQYAMNQ